MLFMISVPIKKVAGLLWMIFIISATLALLAVILSLREDVTGAARIGFAVLAGGSLLMAYFAIRSMSALKKGLMESIRQLKEQFDQRGEYLHATEKMATLGRLAAGVAHEIRNPLTSIKMRLFSLGRELEDESTQKEDIDVIREEVDHLEAIVQNFLQFARPADVKLEPASLGDILSSVLDLLEHRFKDQEITVHLKGSRSPVEVLADRQQLRQVFMNVLLNACDAMPDGGDINISYDLDDGSDGGMIRVRIGNSGSTSPPEDAGQIFEPFFSTRDDGTGLGLSIARQIVEQHGGEIKLDAPGEGESVCFSFTLPLALKEKGHAAHTHH
jgi:signal transduction histidine kinase